MESYGSGANLPNSLTSAPERKVLSVSELNKEARRLLERGLPMTWVEGEISNIARPASGHWYFTLKDKNAQIRCAMFKNRNQYAQIKPRDGQAVVVRGRVSLYEARGDYQLIAENMQDAGVGELQRQFELLKKKLDSEGLFEQSRKRPVPALPQRIGVITSPTGAVIKDILQVLQRRFPGIPVRIYPVAVQGEAAAAQIESALALATQRNDCDVLILARGGGSLEDIWPFNEERVARAIYRCPIPTISAVGHETDVTIADFVADLRAPTPSAAAELAVPDRHAWAVHMQQLSNRLARSIKARLQDLTETLNWLTGRHQQTRPDLRIGQLAQRLDDLEQRLKAQIRVSIGMHQQKLLVLGNRLQNTSPRQTLQRVQSRLESLSARIYQVMQTVLQAKSTALVIVGRALDTIGPQATLDRGYSIVVKKNVLVTSSEQLIIGDELTIRLATGEATANVTKKDGKDSQ